ncbi:hypothetical protein AAFF_G00214600 [Aldrovandia affinis]|uniref:Uncharacterized protein n=1 Tax=Aldrovandia affinis TaxID=143900 RepID=A0AAD7W539_9TELE|nr:hypothetical protein AAFF_G00214600 [Aldrovandia affinis]
MQSSGSTSSQLSHDSLCSSDSFLFSDTDHTEDDADVFLSEGNSRGGQPGRAFYCLDRAGTGSPGSQCACDGFGDQEGSSQIKSGRMERCPSNASYSALVSSSSGVKMESEREGGRTAQTEGDHLFAQKCAELQGFVRPLLELLNGLRKGRFDRGLSSFQQSVAMDRIQRIVGVLQKPTIGGKHLHTLLQVEMMLKLWFPQISPHAPSTNDPSATGCHTPPHKHKDQLHIPVKKRRLSWSDTDSPTLQCKRFQKGGPGGGQVGQGEGGASTQSAVSRAESERGAARLSRHAAENGDEAGGDGKGEKSENKATRWSELSTTRAHVPPTLGLPKSCSSHDSRGAKKGAFEPSPLLRPAAARPHKTVPSPPPHLLLTRACPPTTMPASRVPEQACCHRDRGL